MGWKGIARYAIQAKQDLLAEGTGISTEGRRRVLVSGCRELLTYTETLVRIRTEDGVVAVKGTGLTLRAFHGNRILAEGEWEAIMREELQ